MKMEMVYRFDEEYYPKEEMLSIATLMPVFQDVHKVAQHGGGKSLVVIDRSLVGFFDSP